MNMYIGNLSYNVRESDLRQVMEEYGTVESVKLIMDRNTNRSKGFAFVEMPEAAEAQQAINKLNGAEYVGRQMVDERSIAKKLKELLADNKAKSIPPEWICFFFCISNLVKRHKSILAKPLYHARKPLLQIRKPL